MTIVFPILLGGLALIAIPVVIHLILRQKPITLPFPAFRFLLKRHKTNLRKLRLRHLLLLTLRILIIAAICWALARPLLRTQSLGISSQRPVAAVLLFDTTLSMDYKTSEGVSRLEEAKKRGLELLDQLPEGSRVAILDTAETVFSSRGEWLQSSSQARDRIQDLKLRIDNAPVTRRLGQAYKLLAEVGRGREEGNISSWPRLLCVFSDRTRAAWNAGDRDTILDNADQAPPLFEGLMQAKSSLPALAELLKNLRTKLPPPPGQDYPDQSLLEAIAVLSDRLPDLTRDYLPPEPTLEKMINDVRRRNREVLAHVSGRAGEDTKEFRTQLISALQTALRDLSGVQTLWIDVGVDQPADLALLQLEFPRQPNGQPRQVFADNDIIIARAVVQATGMDFNTEITCQIGNKTYRKAVEAKAGSSQTIPFEIDAQGLKLAPGPHQLDVRLATPDALAFNNQRFATFAIREPRKVLILADSDDAADMLLWAFSALKQSFGLEAELKHPSQLTNNQIELLRYQAIYVLGLSNPSAALWEALHSYVERGGGVAVIPGGNDMKVEAYKDPVAQKLLPGALGTIVKVADGAAWNFEEEPIYQHPFMQRFRDYRESDVVKEPRSAFYFWDVKPFEKEGVALVHYVKDTRDKDAKPRPALLERRFGNGRGKVLLFTTLMQATKSTEPPWNNYLQTLNSFFLVLTGDSARYLAGETESQMLNFVAGKDTPRLALALMDRFKVYALRGPDTQDQVPADDQDSILVVKKVLTPGNYLVEGTGEKARRVGAFSVNAPGEESDLTRVAETDMESLLGAGAVIGLDRKAVLKDSLMGHWQEPVELFSFLLVLLLFLLAVENLLANKFYRKET